MHISQMQRLFSTYFISFLEVRLNLFSINWVDEIYYTLPSIIFCWPSCITNCTKHYFFLLQKICINFSLSNQYCSIAMNHDAVAVVHDYFLFVVFENAEGSSLSSWCNKTLSMDRDHLGYVYWKLKNTRYKLPKSFLIYDLWFMIYDLFELI